MEENKKCIRYGKQERKSGCTPSRQEREQDPFERQLRHGLDGLSIRFNPRYLRWYIVLLCLAGLFCLAAGIRLSETRRTEPGSEKDTGNTPAAVQPVRESLS